MKTFAIGFLLGIFYMFGAVAADKFADCGAGYIVISAGNRDGIPTVECKKLWCRDLENGKIMGKENTAASGYESTPGPDISESSIGNDEVYCFGKRKWCAAQGAFDPVYGGYVMNGDTPGHHVAVLSGNCYKWQLQNPGCKEDEVAINNGTSWTCLKPGSGADGRSAIKSKAIRRISVKPNIRIK